MGNKPIVAGLWHTIDDVDYAKDLIRKLIEWHSGKTDSLSLGAEITEKRLQTYRSSDAKTGLTAKRLTASNLFWVEIIKLCDAKGIEIVPLVSEEATNKADEAMRSNQEIFENLQHSGRVSKRELDDSVVVEVGGKKHHTISSLWKFFTSSERDRLTINTAKTTLVVDNELIRNIPKKKPSLSLVGIVHLDGLQNIAKIIPYPEEGMTLARIKELELMRRCRTGVHAARERMGARARSMKPKKPKRKKGPKRGGRK